MEIKKVNKSQVKSQTTANISPTIQASRSVAASLAKETAIYNSVAGLSVNSLNKALKQKGEEDALLDAAADQKSQDEYIVAKDNYDKFQEEKTALEMKAAEGGSGADYQFDDPADKESYAKLMKNKSESIYKNTKAALEDKKLNMADTTFTNYGKGYQQKAQAIGLNKLLINLDKKSNELSIEYREDPVGYAQAMTQYRMQVKEQLPPTLHAAYDEKALISQNSQSKLINKNVKKIQDEELSATTIEKYDMTRTNFLNAATTGDNAAYISSRNDIKASLDKLVENRLMTRAVADKTYRDADVEAIGQMVTSEFDKLLGTDPAAAAAYLENFSTSTSEQIYGLSKRQTEDGKKLKGNKPNPLDVEYDTIERDKIATQMATKLKKYNTALKAQNKQTKSVNNKYLQEAVDVYKKGNNYNDSKGRISSMTPGSYSQYEMDQFNFYKNNWQKIDEFNQDTLLQQNANLDAMKKVKNRTIEQDDMVEVLTKANEANVKEINEDPGAVANEKAYDFYKNESFVPRFNVSDPRGFIEVVLPFTKQLHSENNSKEYLMSNTQANQTTAYWDGLGEMDQIAYINNMGGVEGADLFFDQLGNQGSEMKVLYNVVHGRGIGAVQTSITILNGQKVIDAKLRTYTEKDVDAYYTQSLDGRGKYQTVETQVAYKKAVIAYAIGANPEAKDLTKDMIETSINEVFGKTVGGFFSNDKQVVYDKSKGQFDDYMDGTTEDQVMKTIPQNAKFYSKDINNPLTAKTLANEIANGKIQLIGTGVNGEYTLKRNGQHVLTSVPSEATNKDGKVWMQHKIYKFKQWSNK